MKKSYLEPKVRIVEIDSEAILANSTPSGSVTPIVPDEPPGAKKGFFDDDEEIGY